MSQSGAPELAPLDALAALLPAPLAGVGPLGLRLVGTCGPTLVLIHGLGRVASAFVLVVRALERAGFSGRIALIDNPGFGASRALPVPLTTEAHARLHEDTLASAGLLADPLHIAGLSFGAMIATALAARLGPRALSLAALAPSALETALFRVSPRAIGTNLKALWPGAPRGAEAYLPLVTHQRTRDQRKNLAEELRQLQRDAGGGGMREAALQTIAAAQFRLIPRRGALPAQRAVFVGDDDALVPVRNAERYAQLLGAPLFRLEHTGHDLGLDAPARIAAALHAFTQGADITAIQAAIRAAAPLDGCCAAESLRSLRP